MGGLREIFFRAQGWDNHQDVFGFKCTDREQYKSVNAKVSDNELTNFNAKVAKEFAKGR